MTSTLHHIVDWGVYLIRFLLNSFRNSQFVNLAIFALVFAAVCIISVLGFAFIFYEEATAQIIGRVAGYFMDNSSDAVIQVNGDGAIFIRYYLYVLFLIGIIGELILRMIARMSKRDLRGVLQKNQTKIFFVTASLFLVIQMVTALALKEWWFAVVGMVLFIVLMAFYFWYRLVSWVVNKIHQFLNSIYTALPPPQI